MNTLRKAVVSLLLASSLVYAQDSVDTVQKADSRFPVLTGNYLGQPAPGKKAVPFAPDIIVNQDNFHGTPVFSPDGNEAYWSVGGGIRILSSKRVKGVWTEPVVTFPGADVPFISPDGNKFFFMTVKLDKGVKTEAICVMDRTPTGWSEPRLLPGTINSIPDLHWQLSVDNKGNLFFGTRNSGVQYSEFVDGTYGAPRMVEELKDVGAFSPYIAPDGSYLIVTEVRDDLALYILFRKADGTWTNGKDISESIGVTGEMLCSMVTPDGKYMFFLKGVGDRTVPYWVDASFIEELRKLELAN
jgi:hypothetical protein